MKKLLPLLLLTFQLHAQQGYVSAGIDLRNATLGSDATKNESAGNFNFKAMLVGNKGTEVGMGFEMFPRIDYNRMYLSAGQQIKITEDIKAVPSLEPSIINRWDDWGGGLGYKDNRSCHLSIALNLGLRYDISERFGLQLNYNLLPRTDTGAKYDDFKVVGSTFFEILIKL